MYIKNCSYNSYKFSHKFTFILIFSFLRNQKQKPNVQQVGGVVTRNVSALSLKRVALYFRAMPNLINFYEGIFLHVIPVRISYMLDKYSRIKSIFKKLAKFAGKNKKYTALYQFPDVSLFSI